MNKTISIHIGGRVFNIEEETYLKLNAYLLAIRSFFSESESTNEIISDIELRIAELFLERITPQKQAIVLSDVDEVIAIMGQPEDYADGDEGRQQGAQSAYNYTYNGRRRVFRDPDNKVLFGTCSGISAWFGWDPIILRAIFVVLLVFFGTGILLYIILTIVIPKAQTTAEKLEMNGEQVNVGNISRKVSQSFENVKEDLRDFRKKNGIKYDSFNHVSRGFSGFISDLGRFISHLLGLFVRIFGKALGLILFVASLLGIMFLIAAMLGWESFFRFSQSGFVWSDHIPAFLNATFMSQGQQQLVMWSAFVTALIPLIIFLLIGIRLLFDYRKVPVHVPVILVVIWFGAITTALASGTQMIKEFEVQAEYTEPVKLRLPSGQKVIVDIDGHSEPQYRFKSNFNHRPIFYSDSVTFPDVESTNVVYQGRTRFTIAMNRIDSIPTLEITRKASGNSQKDAVASAGMMKSIARANGDSLLIYPHFVILKGQKFRAQEVLYTLNLPVGKSVSFTERTAEMLYDVPNLTNTYDHNMVNHTWLMTNEGLTCQTCVADSIPETTSEINL